MRDSMLADLGIIDVRKIYSIIRRAALGIPSSLSVLDTVLAVELWLRRLGNGPSCPQHAEMVDK